jgi:glycosyltransferase involved in cell wall biosynthesis
MRIGIITVNLNNNNGLRKTLMSVLSQDFEEYEHIIIDGGSEDGSRETLTKTKNSKIQWISEPDAGIYDAMNKGIRICKSEYIIFLNSGDVFFDNSVLRKFIDNNFCQDIVFGNLFMEGDKELLRYSKKINFRFLYNYSLPHPSTFFRRSIFDKVGLYDTRYQIVSDWVFFLSAILKYKVSYYYYNETISVFNQDGISSTRLDLCKMERDDYLEREFSYFLDDYMFMDLLEVKLKRYEESRMHQLLLSFQSLMFYSVVRMLVFNSYHWVLRIIRFMLSSNKKENI